MALLNTDLFVIQRPTDANKHFKLTGEKLKEYIAAGDTIVYKGSRDFAQSAQDPSTDGTGVNSGDIYINNNPVVDAVGAWAANINGEAVGPGDRAIWNGTSWDLLHESSDKGVTVLTGLEPIEVDDATPGEPIISVNAALESSAVLPGDRISRSGVVPSIATASDVIASSGNSSPNPEAVVPADLLKETNEEVETIAARVTVNEGDIVDIKADVVDIKQDIVNLDGRVTVNEGDIVDIKADIVTINTEIGDINTEIGDLTLELETLTNGGGLSALKGEDPIEVTTTLIDDTAVEGDANFGKTETTVSIKDGTTVQKGAVQLQEVGVATSAVITTAATPGYVSAYYLVKNFDSFAEA